MRARRAAVTGMGAVAGLGHGVAAIWQGLLDGKRGPRPEPQLTTLGLDVGIGPVALAPNLPLSAPNRATTLALEAVREALADAGDVPRGPRLGVTLGTTLGGITSFLGAVRSGAPARRWSYAGPAHAVATEVQASGPIEVTSTACGSGNVALGVARDLILEGRCDVVLAGGVDSLHDFVISGFASLKALDPEPCRPFDRTRRGLNLGEGASFLVIEEAEHARRRGARIRAILSGYGLSADAVHMTGPDRQGRGAARGMRNALDAAGLTPGGVDFVSLHGTATLFNDLMEAKAMVEVFGERAATVPSNSVKSALGHTLGAAGALEAMICVRVLETGLIPPTVGHEKLDPEIPLRIVHGAPLVADVRVALSTASGFGGTNAAIVLERA